MWDGGREALLALENGSYFWGTSVGASGEAFGELVFNTGMTGYQEVLTDPSYRGQIVVMTYPEIGIYGINPEDMESPHVQVAGYVVHRAVWKPFNWRATLSFTEYLKQAGVVAIEGIDTRAVTKLIRSAGAMRGAISTEDLDPESLLRRVRESPGIAGRDLAAEVSPDSVICAHFEAEFHVVLVDAGVKENILRELKRRGFKITQVPYDISAQKVLRLRPDGVLISNGPGDPAALRRTVRLVREILERGIPLAGICLGHQLLSLAIGGGTYKMRFGHRGINHPVVDLTTGRVLITSHNHGFAVDPTSLGIPWHPLDEAFTPLNPEVLKGTEPLPPECTMAELLPPSPLLGDAPLGFGPVEVTFLSLNDGTVEGLRLRDLPAFSVQFHPEASPGPHDAGDFFDRYAQMLLAHSRS